MARRKYFGKFGFFSDDACDLADFVFSGFERWQIQPRFYEILEEFLPAIREMYQDEDGLDFRRKVNRGLYLRHLLRAAVWGEVLFDEFVNQGLLRPEDYQPFILSILFHDVLEINKRLTREQLIERLTQLKIAESQRITEIVGVLTPGKKEKGVSYQQRKRADFLRVVEKWNLGDKMPLLVKLTDILANLEETVIDLENGKENGQMRALPDRYYVWQERITEIQNLLGEQALPVRVLQERLAKIEDFLFWRLEADQLPDDQRDILASIQAERSFAYC